MSHQTDVNVQNNMQDNASNSFWTRNKWRISGPTLTSGFGAGFCAAAMYWSTLGLQGTMTSVCVWMSSNITAAVGIKVASTVVGAAIAGSLIGLAVGLGVLALYSIYKCCKSSQEPEATRANTRDDGAAVTSGQATVFVPRDDNASGAPLPGVDLLYGTQ